MVANVAAPAIVEAVVEAVVEAGVEAVAKAALPASKAAEATRPLLLLPVGAPAPAMVRTLAPPPTLSKSTPRRVASCRAA